MKKIIYCLLPFLLVFSANSWSSIYIECDEKSRRVQVPVLVSKALHSSCTFMGGIIEANEGWAMINLLNQSPFFIPSQISTQPTEKGNRSYFKSIKARRLNPREVYSAYQFISKALPNATAPIAKQGMVINLTNNLDLDQRFYLFSNGAGYLCTPICKEGNIFLLQHIENQSLF